MIEVRPATCITRSHLTPGITRRPERFDLHEIIRVGGRVHAVVGRRSVEDKCLEFEPNIISGAIEYSLHAPLIREESGALPL
jgi:hypothetical protein